MKIIECGVTMAVPAHVFQGLTPADQKALSAQAAEHLAEELKALVKGTAPRSSFRFQVQDSVDDPLQGPIVPMTLQASFALEDLPTDSEAYQTHQKEVRP